MAVLIITPLMLIAAQGSENSSGHPGKPGCRKSTAIIFNTTLPKAVAQRQRSDKNQCSGS